MFDVEYPEHAFDLWARAFLLTCAIELPIYLMWLKGRFAKWWHAIAVVLLLQVATHPALWYVFPYWEPYWQYVLVAEMCVFTLEALLLWANLGPRPSLRHNLLIAGGAALSANAVSTAWGLAYNAWIVPALSS